jgi:oligopeptidase B
LIETGLHDSQVQYWEPAKWTARLRKFNTADTYILLKTDMESGHGGKSGRFQQLEEAAFEYAFILDMVKR